MARRCNEQITPSSVNILCSTTKCSLASTDTAHHLIDVGNGRPGSIYRVEICAVTLTNFVDFNGCPKFITLCGSGTVSSRSRAPQISVNLNPLSAPGTEEIRTTVEFNDATQRIGPTTFLSPKESYQVDYEMDVL